MQNTAVILVSFSPSSPPSAFFTSFNQLLRCQAAPDRLQRAASGDGLIEHHAYLRLLLRPKRSERSNARAQLTLRPDLFERRQQIHEHLIVHNLAVNHRIAHDCLERDGFAGGRQPFPFP